MEVKYYNNKNNILYAVVGALQYIHIHQDIILETAVSIQKRNRVG